MSRPVPVLPAQIAEQLPDRTVQAQGLSSEQLAAHAVAEWNVQRLPDAQARLAAHAVVGAWHQAMADGVSRHNTAVELAAWILRDARAGAYPAKSGLKWLEGAFREAKPDADEGEWERIVSWAVAQASAEPEQAITERLERIVGTLMLGSPGACGFDPGPEEPGDEDVAVEAERRKARIRIKGQMLAKQDVAEEDETGLGLFEESRSSLKDQLQLPDEDEPFRVKGFVPLGGNTVIIAGRKAGKTTLMNYLAKCLVDDIPFLSDEGKITPIDGTVALWNYEVSAPMYRRWLRETDIAHTEDVHLLHLRGESMPLRNPRQQDTTVKWLKDRNVKVWFIDPWSMAYVGSVENANDESQVGPFLRILDQIKKRAGVSELILTAHTPKAKVEAGDETAIGSQRLEAWPDSLMYIVREGDQRYIRTEGRDVSMPERGLSFNWQTRELHIGSDMDRAMAKRAAKAERHLGVVVAHVQRHPGCSKNSVIAALGADGVDKPTVSQTLEFAVQEGHLRLEHSAKGGPNGTNSYYPGDGFS